MPRDRARKKPSKVTRSKDIDTDDISSRIKPVSNIEGPIKMVLYGRSGTGKTTFAASFPKPALLIDCKDKGTKSVSDVKGLDVFSVEEWDDAEQIYWFLKKDRKYKTVIVDTCTGLQDIAIRKVLSDKNKESDDPMKWGVMKRQDWGDAASKLKVWLGNINDLPSHTVFIAQEKASSVEEDDEDDGAILPEIGPYLMKSVASFLNAAVDTIGNTYKREKVKKKRDKETKRIVEERAVQYCLRLGDSAVYTTKTRKPKSQEVPGFLVDPEFEDLEELINQKD